MENRTLFVSVVVVSSGQMPEKLARCLPALFRNTYPADSFEVMVVDSGSGPAVLSYLRQEEKNHPRLRVILPCQGNIGPARGRNLGIKVARGDIIAFTDDDVVAAMDWLEKLVDGYRRYASIAGVGGITLPDEARLKNSFWARYENRLYLSLLKQKSGEYLSEKRDEHPCYAGNISYRRRVLEEMGGFDESFSPAVYGEDGDLKERVLQLGYRLLFVPVINRHLADYNFPAFWRKEQRRGVGILFFYRRHRLRKPSRFGETLKVGLLPVVFLRHLARSGDLAFSWAATLAFLARQVGKLRFYAEV